MSPPTALAKPAGHWVLLWSCPRWVGSINTPLRTGSWADRKHELLLKCSHGHLLQVAWLDDAMIGYCFSSLGKGSTGEIDSLYIEPQVRRHGIGRRLVEVALRWLVERGCDDIKLWVYPRNTDAMAFYGRLGFTAGPDMREMTETLLLWSLLR